MQARKVSYTAIDSEQLALTDTPNQTNNSQTKITLIKNVPPGKNTTENDSARLLAAYGDCI